MADYEVLQAAQNVGLTREATFPVFSVSMGDGYGRGAVYGNVTGVYKYTLQWSGRDRDTPKIQAITKNGALFGSPVGIPRYLLEFYFRRMANGNDPFWFRDYDHPNLLSRRFELYVLIGNTYKATQSSSNPRLYSVSFQFQTARGYPAQQPPSE